MKAKPNSREERSIPLIKMNHNRPLLAIACTFIFMAILLVSSWAWAQTVPILTATPTGTNQLLITITNSVSTLSYELWTTPVLGDSTTYPWTIAEVGSTGQSNFTVNIGAYPAGFYRALLDTNAIPLWQAADPNNPSAGILTVFIDSPTNGASLQ